MNIRIIKVVALLTIVLLFVFLGNEYLSAKELSKMCNDKIAVSLINNEDIKLVQNCSVNKFLTNKGKVYNFIEIAYGKGEDCPSGCIYNYKTYLTNDVGVIIHKTDSYLKAPDLSLGSNNKLCKYVATSRLGSLLESDPDHIARTLINVDGNYRWKLDLKDFSGHPPGKFNESKKCHRTGTVTTNLDGNDLRLDGEPKFRIE